MTCSENPPIFDPATEHLPYGKPLYAVRRERSVQVPMGDGVHLSTDLYFPEGAEGKLPVILIRTPYDKRKWRIEYYGKPGPYWFASQGYVVAVQDKRGKFESQGMYQFCGGDVQDTEDTVNWLGAQPWCSGAIGMFGCSYLGEIQVRHAPLRNPLVKALCPHAAGGALSAADGRFSNSATRSGGTMELGQMLAWFYQFGSKIAFHPSTGVDAKTMDRVERFFSLSPMVKPLDLRKAAQTLPTIEMMDDPDMPPADWIDFMTRDFSDPWWNQFGFLNGNEQFAAPALHINSWYDYGVAQTIDTWALFQRNAVDASTRDNQYLVIAPTDHCKHEMACKCTMVGERAMGDARFDFHDLYFRWFERWLKGREDALERVPKVQYFVMGRNEWRASDCWPPMGAELRSLYLHSEGRANSRRGDGCLSFSAPEGPQPSDSFVYDPGDPVPSHGGPVCTTGDAGMEGSFDQQRIEERGDILVYSTPPLEEGIEISGPIRVILWVSSSAVDTDFTAKLVDVRPSGKAFNIQEGILRARYREGFDREVRMIPGEIYRIEIDLQATSNWFAPGHRIRLDVSGSNFPRHDRNMNTGGKNYDETDYITATNVIHHDREHPSRIMVYVLEEAAKGGRGVDI